MKTPAEMFAVFRVEGTDITTMGLVLENTNANVRSVQKREERVEAQVEVQVHPQLLVLYLKTPAEMFAVFRVEGADITTVGLGGGDSSVVRAPNS